MENFYVLEFTYGTSVQLEIFKIKAKTRSKALEKGEALSHNESTLVVVSEKEYKDIAKSFNNIK